jgi:peptidoglycan/LPS O-acetylase OafA/YrhL
MFRILPVFLLAAIAGVAVLPILAAENPQATLILNGMTEASLPCFLARITTLASFSSYFDPCAYSGNAPLATVMVEIDLYIFYGIFFLIFGWPGREASGLLFIATGLLLSLVIISLSTYEYQRWFQQNCFISFLPYWWMGAAVLDQSVATKLRRFVPSIIVSWIFLAVLVAFFGGGAVAGEMKKLCYGLLVAALIVKIDSVPIVDNPLSALGRAGYSLYAFHSPVFCLGLIYGLSAVMSLMLAIGIGILSYALIEKPSMRINAVLSSRRSLDRL